MLQCLFFVMVLLPPLVRCESSTQSLAAIVNCAGWVNTTPFETEQGEEAGRCERISVTLCYNNSSTLENSCCSDVENSECDQTTFKILATVFGIMSLVLIVFSGILSVVILYQLCHGSGGFMSGSQRRASTGINEAYGILEDFKCTGIPGTTCPELQTEENVNLVESKQDNEFDIGVSSLNSAFILQENNDPNTNDISSNAGYLPVLAAGSSLPPLSGESNDDDEVEYTYIAARFPATNLNTVGKTVAVDANIAYGSIEIVQQKVQVKEKKAITKSYDSAAVISTTPQLLVIQQAKKGLKPSQSSPSVTTSQAGIAVDVKAEHRVSTLAQEFENLLQPIQPKVKNDRQDRP